MLTSQKAKMKTAQRNVLVTLIATAIFVNALILFAGDIALQNYLGNLVRPIVASAATALALVVVARQGLAGIFGRSYAAMAGGLVLYLIAEILWAYYSIGIGIEVPFPSLADAFWLAAYAPFGYGLFKLANLYKGIKRTNTRSTIIMAVLVGIFACYYIVQLIFVSDVSTPDGALALGIGIAYPILDAILVVPALVAVLSAGRGYLTAVPWIFISWIFTAIADSIFGFTAITSMAYDISIWNVFYNIAYLSMAAGMYWHNRYMILDIKQIKTDSGRESVAA
ncbi:MAG TPA: hypothetical protein VGQ03_08705 [Nitrososphaera sp.]|nr:hypothetical protein [Nitrososphaera sp.]